MQQMNKNEKSIQLKCSLSELKRFTGLPLRPFWLKSLRDLKATTRDSPRHVCMRPSCGVFKCRPVAAIACPIGSTFHTGHRTPPPRGIAAGAPRPRVSSTVTSAAQCSVLRWLLEYLTATLSPVLFSVRSELELDHCRGV